MTMPLTSISSSEVGIKINEWYRHIQRFNVTDAIMLREQINREMELMEENQDLLLYYSLVDYRHNLMLNYVKPGEPAPEFFEEVVESMNDNSNRVTGMSKYYYNFFRGMYEFEKNEYVNAITFYKRAERLLSFVQDQIERAEVYYKMAEVYYYMKQTHFSMNYVVQALDTYNEHETYGIRRIQCHFVIAGNYDDFKRHEKSLPHLETALDLARDLTQKQKKDKMIGSALFNIGNCYYAQYNSGYDSEALHKAEKYLRQSVEVFEKADLDNLAKSLYTLAHVLFKLNKKDQAIKVYERGIRASERFDDQFTLFKLKFLKGLYINSVDYNQISSVFSYLRNKELDVYIEEFSQDVAKYNKEKGDKEIAIDFYEKSIDARIRIQRGGCLYEV
ncbi:aspartate phosphatase [Bacillus subtilis]|uniref:Rap family tetratricopeptide repeat protein n=1 Tax=Bacillus subtilis TaxID=1423 RepID=UPI00202A6440|nr:Rap family tetratricopeptide repeat protein [Bacillus subtilis]MEC0326787.1 aspartate phosphatase [Bacillus subtilis]MEC0412528.1 aspartate phosphatase [Bacillus subtilis]MEC0420468.1 aspartate phosphatase [Bacillus subtilis]UWJ03544.1 aspartate phosphatase [Bacillus subtilis]